MVAAAGLAAAALPMRSAWARMACYLLAAVALVTGPYLWHGFHDIIMRGAIATEADQIVFLTLLVESMVLVRLRSEGRRVGKEGVSTCRSRWSPNQDKTKRNKLIVLEYNEYR